MFSALSVGKPTERFGPIGCDGWLLYGLEGDVAVGAMDGFDYFFIAIPKRVKLDCVPLLLRALIEKLVQGGAFVEWIAHNPGNRDGDGDFLKGRAPSHAIGIEHGNLAGEMDLLQCAARGEGCIGDCG